MRYGTVVATHKRVPVEPKDPHWLQCTSMHALGVGCLEGCERIDGSYSRGANGIAYPV